MAVNFIAVRQGVLAIVLGLVAGCSRAPEADVPAPDADTAPVPKADGPGAVRPIPDRPAPPPPADSDRVIEGLVLSAMLQDADGDRAGLVDERSGRAGLVRAGDRFAEFTVSAVDLDRRMVVLERNGEYHTLRMRTSAPENGTGAAAFGIDEAGADALPGPRGLPDPVRFEPTDDERARGIDPNDSKTWPEDYRGPGIERALLEAGEKR